MYDSLVKTAAKIGTTVASNPIGQMLLEYTEKCLWAVEKSVQWYMVPEQKPEHKDEDVPSTEVQEPAAASSSEKSDDTVEPETETVRPLPWVLFFPLLVCLKAAKTSIDVCSYVLRRESVEPSSIVEFIQTRRNLLKEIKEQIKSNQEEEKISSEPSDDSTTQTSCNDNPEVPEIKVLQATPEKETIVERKIEMETTTAPASEPATSETVSPSESATSSESSPSESETVLEPSDTSPIEEIVESDNGNDSSSTLEASLTEKDDTKDEDEDFHSVKSSSTYFSPDSSYFSPDSSYSLQSVSEESKAGDNLTSELEKDTKELSIAAAIEDLRSLSVTEEAPLPTPTSSLSGSTSSVKQTESTKKRTSFSSFFQVKRRTT